MLNKIKIYRRSDSQAQDTFLLHYLGNTISLQLNDIKASTFTLTKTDPLGKFTKEMEGWWFCEEYVVTIDNSDAIIFVYSGKCVINIDLFKDSIFLGTRFVRKHIAISDLIQVEYPEFIGKKEIDYSIGEDKYLKLLDLINN